MIRNPNDIQDGAKKIRMLIAGYPGIGKSTLALSAPRPLHIDCDFGIDRIEPRYRMPYIQPRSYDEILNDLFLSTPSARRATAKTETKSLFSNKLYNILHEFRRALIYNGSKNYPNHAK